MCPVYGQHTRDKSVNNAANDGEKHLNSGSIIVHIQIYFSPLRSRARLSMPLQFTSPVNLPYFSFSFSVRLVKAWKAPLSKARQGPVSRFPSVRGGLQAACFRSIPLCSPASRKEDTRGKMNRTCLRPVLFPVSSQTVLPPPFIQRLFHFAFRFNPLGGWKKKSRSKVMPVFLYHQGASLSRQAGGCCISY